MSIQQLEADVRSLSEEELAKFAGWFDAYLTTTGLADEEDDEPALSPDQRAELDRRLDALDADPAMTVPWEGTKEKVLAKLDEILTAKTRRR